MKFSVQELLVCAERELRLRQRVYENRVLTGRMSQQEADRQIEMMAEIAELLRRQAEAERLI